MKLSSRSGKHSGNLELNMTPMIDCVFLLLIFFMTTSAFVKAEKELNSGIKVQRAARAASDLQPAIVEIVRGTSGEFVYRLGGRDLTSPAELTNVLRQFDNKSQGAFVRVSDDAQFDLAASAIHACKSAGFSGVHYVPLSESK